MIRALVFCAAMFGSCMLVGCSQVTLLRTQELRATQADLQASIDSLNTEIKKMQSMMGAGFQEQLATVKDQEQSLNRMKADIQALISNLERQLSLLEGRLDESQHRLANIAEMTDRIDSKEFVIKGALAAGEKADSGQQGKEGKIVVKEKTDVDKLYKLAYQDFQSGKLDLAREGFEDLVKNYPQNDLADNAQYWIGECFYAKREYKKAAGQYQKVLTLFPQGNKAPAALYKMGLALEKSRDREGRNKAWKQLTEQFPGSNEARLAQEKLEN